MANEALQGEGAPSERCLVTSRKQRCCGVVHHERFPQDQLSGPCGQRGAVSHPGGLREAMEASLPAGPQHHIQQPEFSLPVISMVLFPSTGLPQPSPRAAQVPDEGLCQAAPSAKAAH